MAMRKRDDEVFPNAAGIDIGASSHRVAVPRYLAEQAGCEPVREVGAMTDDLNALADWLLACGVDTVALESAGVYWIPVYEVLEQRGLKVWLGGRAADEVRARSQERRAGLPVAAEAHEPGAAARGLAPRRRSLRGSRRGAPARGSAISWRKTASDYPFHGGFLDIHGLMFNIGGGKVVDFWSNGNFSGGAPGPVNYGVAVATADAALDFVDGGVAAIPEPSSYALILAGLGVLGSVVRRPKRS